MHLYRNGFLDQSPAVNNPNKQALPLAEERSIRNIRVGIVCVWNACSMIAKKNVNYTFNSECKNIHQTDIFIIYIAHQLLL